jgi:hypothetical protein
MHFTCVLYWLSVPINDLIFLLTYLFTYLLSYFMEQSPSWDANRFAASQEIPRIYATRMFITAFTSPRQLFLSWAFLLWTFRNKIHFHGDDLLAPRPTPKLEDHPLSAVRDCLFNIFAAPLHIGGRSAIRNLRTRHAVMTGTHLTWIWFSSILKIVTYCLILKKTKSLTVIKYPGLIYDYNI